MKLNFYLISISIAGIAGYLIEPNLRDHFLSDATPQAKVLAANTAPIPVIEPVKPAAVTQLVPKPKIEQTVEPIPQVIAEPEVITPPEPELPVAVEKTPLSEPAILAEVLPEKSPKALAVITAMKTSLKAGRVNEFKYAQVTDWNEGPEVTVDGQVYQTGVASYKAQTVFGEKTIQAKAIIKAGNVERWVWPKTGLDIH